MPSIDVMDVVTAYQQGWCDALDASISALNDAKFQLGKEAERKQADTPQTESTGSPIGDYRDGVGAWQTEPAGCVKGWSSNCTFCERYFSCDYLSGRQTDCGWK